MPKWRPGTQKIQLGIGKPKEPSYQDAARRRLQKKAKDQAANVSKNGGLFDTKLWDAAFPRSDANSMRRENANDKKYGTKRRFPQTKPENVMKVPSKKPRPTFNFDNEVPTRGYKSTR